MDKLKMHTPDKAEENFRKLAELFPDALTEIVDENGEVVRAIDKDVLMQEISAQVVDGNQERYQFTWPDKKKSVVLANAPIAKTLRLQPEKSIGRDGTSGSIDSDNIYIEGDNLDVLKLLQETYLGKIKMIYIDPPYNTGNDFVYNDSFKQDADEYADNSGQVDEDGNRLVQNLESNGRFHSDWLNMIYPRLRISKDLLTDDGIIFISIDDHEVENLKKICNEIFGAYNFVSELIWQNKKGGGNDSTFVAIEHEYILCYAKSKNSLGEFYETYSEEYVKRYKEEDEISKFYWDTFKRKSGKQYYPITCPDGTVLEYDEDGNPISWLRSKPRFDSDIKNGEIRIVKNGDKWSVQFKQRIPKGKTPRSILETKQVLSDQGTTSTGADDIYQYFKKDVFSNPKPVSLINFLIGFGLHDGDTVLDFFSGSGTTAEAVMQSNLNGEKYKYILVQLPENIDPMLLSSSANAKRVAENAVSVLDELSKAHLITELAEERVKRAGDRIRENRVNVDVGFRCFKVDSSNMKDVFYKPNEYGQLSLDNFTDNIKEGRSGADLLIQVMLELGIDLSSEIHCEDDNDKKIYIVENNYLIACFDNNITESTVKTIAQKHPFYVVIRDSGYASDSVAANFEQIFETYSPNTVRKVL